jgi:4-amino-4-deoxy-L-arabinose transferase-like glycosyltransferase
MKKYLIQTILAIIILSALLLRFYKLNQVPPAISWDEASFSYNAYTIAHWAKDEWGRTLPLSFESFGEYKNPIDIYLSAIFIGIGGLNDFSARLPAALFGVANVILIYFLAKKLFNDKIVALTASFMLAVSPYSLQFSRQHHEFNIAFFFFLLGVTLFIHAIRKKGSCFLFSALSFCLSILTYNAAKVVVPLTLAFLVILYWKDIWRIKKDAIWGIVPVIFLLLAFIFNRNLTGITRFQQTSVSNETIQKTFLYQKTKIRALGRMETIIKQYPAHFSYQYLFVSGDANPRHSIQTVGEFYRSDLPLLLIGFGYLLYLILKKKSKESLFLLFWILVAPLPSALAAEAPHAARAMFMLGSYLILAGLGLTALMGLTKNNFVKGSIVAAFLFATGFCLTAYLKDYYQKYPAKYAIEWQYGMKQVVEYLNRTRGVKKVYMTAERNQPYIFYLFYSKTPLPEYLDTFKPNTGPRSGASRIDSFGKYYFGNWNIVDSAPISGVYYVLTPYEYSGLKDLQMFDIRKVVKYPDSTDAFYIITRL